MNENKDTRRIYLDNNATTPIDPRIMEVMSHCYKENFGNPSSIHWFGQNAKKALDDAREKVAAFINATPSEIIFTSSGTEADNLALLGIAQARKDFSRNKIIISEIEHHAILRTADTLETDGFIIIKAPVNQEGMVDITALEQLVDDKVLLVSIMTANNETGVIQPISRIAELAHSQGALLHTDAVQAAGKIELSIEKMGCDLMSLSAHKIYGPKGIGALYLNKKTTIHPCLYGGSQERGRRAGTENIAHIAAFGKACELCLEEYHERDIINRLRDTMQNRITRAINNAVIHGKNAARIPNTLSIGFPGIDAEALVIHLDLKGIAVSTGAACSSGIIEPSHVLRAMRVPKELLLSTIRISLGRFSTEEELNNACAILISVIEQLKLNSP